MTDPTSRAQKILAAFNDRFERCVSYEDDLVALCLAAALRAAADEVVPSDLTEPRNYLPMAIECQRIRRELLAIAAELEAMP